MELSRYLYRSCVSQLTQGATLVRQQCSIAAQTKSLPMRESGRSPVGSRRLNRYGLMTEGKKAPCKSLDRAKSANLQFDDRDWTSIIYYWRSEDDLWPELNPSRDVSVLSLCKPFPLRKRQPECLILVYWDINDLAHLRTPFTDEHQWVFSSCFCCYRLSKSSHWSLCRNGQTTVSE